MNTSTRTAGIIIIGDEILSGKVQDINSFFLASELRKLGVNLMRISVIPDNTEVIGREAMEFSGKHDFVFTSGGVGPTHDDVTMEGIARGFDTRLIRHARLEEYFRLKYGDALNKAVLKMAEVPEGSEIIDFNDMSFPLVMYRNIFIFPGIPEYLRNKFSLIKERFRSSAFYLRRLFLNANESDIAEILNTLVEESRGVLFGSYPVLGNPEYKIIITAESKSEDAVSRSMDELIRRIPENIIARVQ
ncbi:MAG: competence/damage-inducible protein A [Thermodesulfovibrionales bacterium]